MTELDQCIQMKEDSINEKKNKQNIDREIIQETIKEGIMVTMNTQMIITEMVNITKMAKEVISRHRMEIRVAIKGMVKEITN